MKRALLINTNGSIEVIHLDPTDELSQLQTAVGGYVQAVYPNPDTTLWLNEDGRILELPINQPATEVWEALRPGGADTLRGVVVVTGSADGNGETLPITAETESTIRSVQ